MDAYIFYDTILSSSRPKPSQSPAAEYVENLYNRASKTKDFVLVSPKQNHYNEGYDELSSAPLSNTSSIGSFTVSKSSTNIYLPEIDDAASDVSLPKVTINPLSELYFPDNDDGLDLDSLGSGTGETTVEKTITFGPENNLSPCFNQTDTIARPGVMKMVTSSETQTDDESVAA